MPLRTELDKAKSSAFDKFLNEEIAPYLRENNLFLNGENIQTKDINYVIEFCQSDSIYNTSWQDEMQFKVDGITIETYGTGDILKSLHPKVYEFLDDAQDHCPNFLDRLAGKTEKQPVKDWDKVKFILEQDINEDNDKGQFVSYFFNEFKSLMLTADFERFEKLLQEY